MPVTKTAVLKMVPHARPGLGSRSDENASFVSRVLDTCCSNLRRQLTCSSGGSALLVCLGRTHFRDVCTYEGTMMGHWAGLIDLTRS